MEEKRDEIKSSIRTVFGYRNLHKFFPFRSNNAQSHGFSLIELLVVIGVIGILTSSLILIIDPITQIRKSHDSRRISDLKQIQSGLELYRADQGIYPDTSELAGPSLQKDGVTYMNKIPIDPSEGSYNYSSDPPYNDYTIYACTEISKDPPGAEAVATTICSSGWRFIFTSP